MTLERLYSFQKYNIMLQRLIYLIGEQVVTSCFANMLQHGIHGFRIHIQLRQKRISPGLNLHPLSVYFSCSES